MPSVQNEKDAALVLGELITDLIKAFPDIESPKVHFSRAYEIQVNELPCISVEIGADIPTEPDGLGSTQFTDSLLTVYVDIYDQSNSAKGLDRVLRQRALCHKAIMADFTLGNTVAQVIYGGAAEPVYDPELGLPGWTLRLTFIVHYRFDDSDRTILIN